MEWNDFFNEIKNKEYFKNLNNFLDEEYKNKIIYPPRDEIYNAFKSCSLSSLKVVIIGQDPYFNKNQAMGLAFSVKEGVKLPPSLENIYKEIEIEFNSIMNYQSGDLTYLSKQGVFLINPILTVIEGKPLSHNTKEYQLFFKDLMMFIDKIDKPIVFILWGNKAKSYEKYILNKNRLIIKTTHPSPLGANKGGFFNTDMFKKTNEYLKKHGINEIIWGNTSF